jgi:thymidylate synthase
MIHYIGHPASIYRWQLNDLLVAPEVVVRGRRTRELLNVVTEIPHPRDRLGIVPGRRFNPWLALSEALWLLAGRNDLAALEPYNKRIREFSDDGVTLYGAYGYRLRDQIESLLARLRADPADRRAVLSIWQPADLTASTFDPPCNTLLMFKLRDGALQMTVHCRSNDLHWGLHAVNAVQFGILQEYIAARLGAELGPQIHWSDSLHIYLDGPAATLTERMLARADEPVRELTGAELFPAAELPPHEQFKDCCDVALGGGIKLGSQALPFLQFADDFLRFYRRRDEHVDSTFTCRYPEQFNDWVEAGNVWLTEASREDQKEEEHAQ